MNKSTNIMYHSNKLHQMTMNIHQYAENDKAIQYKKYEMRARLSNSNM